MSNEIFNKLTKIIYEIKAHEDIRPEYAFKDDLEFDSLDMVDFYFEAERVFNIKIPDSDLSQYELNTIQKFTDYIQKKIA